MYPEGFQWDEAKNEVNIEKHGIDFSDAATIFKRPILDQYDDRKDYGKLRYSSIGLMDNDVIVNVTRTERDGNIRIISARCVSEKAKERYIELTREYNQ